MQFKMKKKSHDKVKKFFNVVQLSDGIRRHRICSTMAEVLLPDGTKSLPELIWPYHPMYSVTMGTISQELIN